MKLVSTKFESKGQEKFSVSCSDSDNLNSFSYKANFKELCIALFANHIGHQRVSETCKRGLRSQSSLQNRTIQSVPLKLKVRNDVIVDQ